MTAAYHWQSPMGPLTLAQQDGALTHLLFDFVDMPAPLADTPLFQQARRQLEEYFAGERQVFSLPLSPRGTDFQRRVWQALQAIPYGQTCTYGDIARQVGSPKAFRAVGMANHRNPISIIIPCHRVIGASGGLTGYGGGLPLKQALLELEQHTLHARQVDGLNS